MINLYFLSNHDQIHFIQKARLEQAGMKNKQNIKKSHVKNKYCSK